MTKMQIIAMNWTIIQFWSSQYVDFLFQFSAPLVDQNRLMLLILRNHFNMRMTPKSTLCLTVKCVWEQFSKSNDG